MVTVRMIVGFECMTIPGGPGIVMMEHEAPITARRAQRDMM